MPRLKVKSETVQMESGVQVTEAARVNLTTAKPDMTAHASPALALQIDLEQSWESRHSREPAHVASIPLGWTLIGMSVVCAAFWYAVLHLVF